MLHRTTGIVGKNQEKLFGLRRKEQTGPCKNLELAIYNLWQLWQETRFILSVLTGSMDSSEHILRTFCNAWGRHGKIFIIILDLFGHLLQRHKGTDLIQGWATTYVSSSSTIDDKCYSVSENEQIFNCTAFQTSWIARDHDAVHKIKGMWIKLFIKVQTWNY